MFSSVLEGQPFPKSKKQQESSGWRWGRGEQNLISWSEKSNNPWWLGGNKFHNQVAQMLECELKHNQQHIDNVEMNDDKPHNENMTLTKQYIKVLHRTKVT